MRRIARIIHQIKGTSSRNDKMAILKEHSDDIEFKEVMRFIYNPYIRTGISGAKLRNGEHSKKDKDLTVGFMMNHFSNNQTGSAADVKLAWSFINAHEGAARELAKALVMKDLKIGVTATTLNNVYGDAFIPMVGCMLGVSYSDFKDRTEGPFVVTEKLDGVRRLLIKEKGRCKLYSRAGIRDEGLIEIMAEAAYLPDNTVYDGELIARGDFKDSIALRQATNAIANRKGVRRGLDFRIFDIIPLDEYHKGQSKYGAIDRKILLGALFGDSSISLLTDDWARLIVAFDIEYDFEVISPVPILGKVTSEQDIMDIADTIWEQGGEGVMLNTVKGKYQVKRSRELLKVKDLLSLDLKVVDVMEGQGKYEGSLGSLVVDYKGYRVGVGSGLTDAQRDDYWKRRDELIGATVEIDCFGESTDKAGNTSLSCPIFKGIRMDKHVI